MDKIIDFKCLSYEDIILNDDELNSLAITFPQVHCDKEMLIKMAKAIKAKSKAPYCELPFCHTLEAENLGAKINYGNNVIGPRTGEYLTTNFNDLLTLTELNFTSGRMKVVLEAVQELSVNNEVVLLNINGPFTILNNLIDSKYIFKALRKESDLAWTVFAKLQDDLLEYLEVAKKLNVKLISFADPMGGVDILGPQLMMDYLEHFVYPFVTKAQEICADKMILNLCPKLTYALTSTNKAYFKDLIFNEPITYGEALVSLQGQGIVVGEMCIQNMNSVLEANRIKQLILV